MNAHKLYIWIVVGAFVIFGIVLLALPRPKFSVLEKRELTKFPDFSKEKLASGEYTREIGHWFSDTEPFRDEIMEASMKLRQLLKLQLGGDEAITIHRNNSGADVPPPPENATAEEMEAYRNRINAMENAKIADAGIIVVGSGKNVRALMAFNGYKGGEAFAAAVNEYKTQLGPGVNVYALVAPIATEFYLPDAARGSSKPQLPTIQNIYAHLKGGAKGVNVYTPLARHVDEDIYLRTDHHWAPRGAYYAAEALAKAAGVPFRPLTSYDKHVVRGFVGTMYAYSHDISVKNAPEDFVYYTPRGLNYTTTYTTYTTNEDYRVCAQLRPANGPFFYHFKDGSGAAYSTFMGSDMRLTQVKTGTPGHRRLLIIKDSYGNALPGWLFYSFAEVHVIDFRYFPDNVAQYVRRHGITDVAVCMNIYNAYSNSVPAKLRTLLRQHDGSMGPRTVPKPVETKPQVPEETTPTEPEPTPTPTEEPTEAVIPE